MCDRDPPTQGEANVTDAEFDTHFAQYDALAILTQLGKMTRSVQLHNGTGYAISDTSDLIAVVEQELYQQMTGRE